MTTLYLAMTLVFQKDYYSFDMTALKDLQNKLDQSHTTCIRLPANMMDVYNK